MKSTSILRYSLLSALTLAAPSLVTTASAAVIVDPTLASIIDPAGAEDVTLGAGSDDESHGTVVTTLNARSDLRVLQDFTGFTGGGSAGVPTTENIVSLTNAAFPDIRFSMNSDDGNTGGFTNQISANTSPGTNAMNLDNDGIVSPTLTINFGTWNGTSFTADRDVAAAGFVLTQVLNSTVRAFDVTFKDSLGATITSFTNLAGDSSIEGSWPEIYVGWDSDAEGTNAIAEIVVAVKNVGAGNGASSGFDDFAFTATVPEPSAVLLAGLGSLFLLRRRRL